jgi:hypothetical protein
MQVLNGSQTKSLAQLRLACRDWVSLHALLLEYSTSAAASSQSSHACKTLRCGLPSKVARASIMHCTAGSAHEAGGVSRGGAAPPPAV